MAVLMGIRLLAALILGAAGAFVGAVVAAMGFSMWGAGGYLTLVPIGFLAGFIGSVTAKDK